LGSGELFVTGAIAAIAAIGVALLRRRRARPPA